MNIAFFADGEEKYSFKGFSRQTEGQPIELDTSGVRTLSIKTSNEGSYSCGWIFLVDSFFEKMDSTVACNEYATLSDVVLIDSNDYSSDVTLMKDSFGEFHDGSKRFDASNAAFALYNLKGEYTTFSCLVATSPATDSGAY